MFVCIVLPDNGLRPRPTGGYGLNPMDPMDQQVANSVPYHCHTEIA